MILIKIDRDSIKRNPRAGATFSWFHGARSVTFEINGGGRIPVDLIDKVIITEWLGFGLPEMAVALRGHIINPDDALLFIAIPGISITVDNGLEKVSHLPQPEWLFEYENTGIRCDSCGSVVKVEDIESDSFYDGDDDNFIDQICPVCKAQDSFGDIEYESISEAVKDVKL
jgi:hypothetical protein